MAVHDKLVDEARLVSLPGGIQSLSVRKLVLHFYSACKFSIGYGLRCTSPSGNEWRAAADFKRSCLLGISRGRILTICLDGIAKLVYRTSKQYRGLLYHHHNSQSQIVLNSLGPLSSSTPNRIFRQILPREHFSTPLLSSHPRTSNHSGTRFVASLR